jgi:PAS domain S-box-containing protein
LPPARQAARPIVLCRAMEALGANEEEAALATDTKSQKALQNEVVALRQRVAELEQELALCQQATVDIWPYQITAVEAALDGIAFLDQQGDYIYMNQAHAEVHGYDRPADLIGQSWTTVVPDDQLDRFAQEYMPRLQRDGHWRGEMISKRRDGSLHPTDIALSLVEGGGMVCIVRDITRRKQADAELQRSQLLLQLVMDNIPQAIFWKDRNLTYLGCNQRFARDAGLGSSNEIVGKTDFEMPWIEQAELYRSDDKQVIDSDTPKLNFEEPIQMVSGKGWLRTTKVPLHDNSGAVVAVLGMYEDITQQKQNEADRLHLQEEIIRTQAAALAELSTPLIPITDTVMVMPLIGTVDSRRAQQVIETLLVGIANGQAQTAILDITGVPVVDTQVANALVRAAQSVKLLGAQVVLTGIRPEVAQTLVGLGVDLSGITTSSTLQRGVAHALGQD